MRIFPSRDVFSHLTVTYHIWAVIYAIGIGLLIGHASAIGSWHVVLWAVLPAVVVLVLKPYLQLLVLAVLSIWWQPVVSLGDLDATAFDLVLVITWLSSTGAAVLAAQTQRGGMVQAKRLAVGLVVLSVMAGIIGSIGAALSGGFGAFLKGLALYLKRWGEYAVIPLAAVLFLDERRARAIWRVMLLTGIIVASISVVVPGYLGRATSVVFNPNVLGLLCVIVSNMAVASLMFGKDTSLGVLALAAGLLGIVVSASRSAGIGFTASVVYWMWVFRARLFRWRHLKYAGLVAALTLIGFLVAGDFVQVAANRWRGILAEGAASSSVSARIDAWQVSLHMITDRPLLGYGIGQVPAYGSRYVSEYARIIQSTISTSDNQFIDILLESGVIGMLFATFMFIALWRIATQRGVQANRSNDCSSMAAQALRSVLVAFLVAGITVPSFSSPFTSAWVWFLAGVVASERRFVDICEPAARLPVLRNEAK